MPGVIDYDGPVPAYRQLADLIRARVESGEYPPGRRILSKRDAEQEFGVGGHTFDRAVRLLADEGLVKSVKGMGWFVTEPM
ncbi:MAG TPA: GntR family transcriptional regulator [Streptosporangiaceae bacterium]|nr:GntR family transcriptional regulator [Streptosporangiaceae bacterium]